jgi:O-antigen/teichoic acid export membrane protein
VTTPSRFGVTGGSYAGGVVLQIVVQALSLPVLTRLLEPAEYGLVATALVVGNLLAVVVDLGLSRTVTRAWFRGGDGPAEAKSLVVLGLLAVTAVSLLAAGTAPVWGAWVRDDALVQVAVLLAAAMAARNVLLGLLRAQARARAYLAVMVLSTSGAQLFGLAAAAVGRTSFSYVFGLAAGSAVAALLGVLLVRPQVRPLRWRGLWAWATRFGLILVPGELAAVAIWFSDRLVVERLLGLEAVGRYQVAYTLGSVLLMLAMGVSQAWGPVVYAAEPAERGRVAEETRAVLLAAGGLCAAALALAAPPVLVAVVPAEYRPEGLSGVTAVVALCVLPLLAQQGAAHLLTAAERTGVLAAGAVGAAGLNLLATLLLVPVLGLLGAALATLVAYLAWAVFLTARAQREAGGSFRFRPSPWAVGAVGALLGVLLPLGGAGLALRAAGVLVCGLLVLARLRPLLAARGTSAGTVVG